LTVVTYYANGSLNEEATLTDHSGCAVTYRNNGKSYLVSAGDKTIKILRLMTRELQYTLEGHTNWVKSLAIFDLEKTFSSQVEAMMKPQTLELDQ